MSNISKRLFLGSRKFSSTGDDDNASVSSDTSTTDNSWIQRLRISNAADSTLDEMMRNMYQDPDILEEKCKDPYGENAKRRSLSSSTDGLRLGGVSEEGSESTNRDIKAMSRRRSSVTKMMKSPDDVINNLDKNFFSTDFDPVLHQLTAMEQWDSADLMERFMSTIEDTDTDKDMVLVKLAEMIELNYSELMECMRDVHAIDVDLTRTGFQITNSRRKLESGKKLIVTGTMDIARLSRYRSNLAEVSEILGKVQSIQNLYATLQNCITTGDLGKAAECAYDLLTNLQDDLYSESGGVGGVINAMEDFAGSVQRLLPTIRQKTDKALFRLISRKFTPAEFENILKAYMLLDDMQENMGVYITTSKIGAAMSSSDDAVDPSVLYDEEGCLDGLCRRIQRYHMNDIKLCLHNAVLEFVYVKQTKNSNDEDLNRIEDLDELSAEELYERVTADMFVPCIVRSCELLADIVHTNYLTTQWQWHKLPFNERSNGDDTFLNQYGIDCEESISEKKNDNDDNCDGGLVDKVNRQHARLVAVSENIIRSRVFIWKEIEIAIVEFLRSLSPTEAIPLDDFVCMMWALRTFCKLGEEFGGSKCNALIAAIEEQSIHYAHNIHMDSCQLLTQMIAAEPWRSVPIQLGEVGGIMGVLRINMGVDKQENSKGVATSGRGRIVLKGMVDEAIARSKYRASVTTMNRANLAAKYSSSSSLSGEICDDGQSVRNVSSTNSAEFAESSISILRLFPSNGNPFHCVGYDNSLKGACNLNDLQRTDDASNDVVPESYTSYMNEMLSTLLTDENAGSTLSKRSQERTAAMVVTQTSLHGISKFSGQYLQLMQLLPSASCDIYEGLCQLFDFYLFAVFMGFISTDDRYHFFIKKTRSTAPPPQQAQDFEALRNCMQVLLNRSNDRSVESSQEDRSNPFVTLDLLREVHEPIVVQRSDHSTYFALNERIVAGESCWFAAKVLSELSSKIVSLLPENFSQKVRRFVSDYQQVADQLRSLIYRTMCPMLIDQSNLMNHLVEQSGWDQKKMREEPHEWVDVLVNMCTGVWEYMEEGEEFADASAQVREQVWLEICQCAFDTVLEGLSRVRKCSTEGRASMTMDISALHTGLNSVHVCRPPRGKQYVDNYVKALYLSDEEVVHWAHQNWQSYAQRHLHGLLNQAMSSVMKKKRLKDALASLDALYEQNDFHA